MGNGIVQASFTSGEIAPALHGRVDFERYYTGLKTCRNLIVRPFGGVASRPGTQFVTEVLDSTRKARLIPFEFNTTQAYILVFGHHTMQVVMNGGVVMNGMVPVQIATPWGENDLYLLKYTQSNDVMTICHPNYPQQQLSRTSHTSWTLAAFNNTGGPFQDINIDSSITVSATGVNGTVAITSNVALFQASHAGMMMYLEQSPNTLVPVWEVQKVIDINTVRRAGSNYYQALSSGTTGTVRPSTLEGCEADGDPGVTWQYLHSGNGIVLITAYISPTQVTATVLSRLPDSIVNAVMSKNITSVTAGDGVSTNVKIGIAAHNFADGDIVTIAGGVGTTDLVGTWPVIVDNANQFELSGCFGGSSYVSGGTAAKTLSGTPAYKWAFEGWGVLPSYPGTTGYSQQRQIFGGSPSKPQSYWMSQTAGFTDFSTNVPLLDTDAIAVTLNSQKVNEIRHFVELSDLLILTSGGPFRLVPGTDGVIAPGKGAPKRQGYSGCSHVRPLVLDTQALFIQEKGSQVRSLAYNWQADSFIGDDLTILSSHLFYKHTLVDWCFQTTPFSCAWAVREDGALLSFAYLPAQQVAGWSRHDTDGLFESTACISEGAEDVVYFLVNRTVGGIQQRYVERMSTRLYLTMADAFFVDCGLTYDGRNATATTVTASGGTLWDQTEVLTLAASANLFQTGDVGDSINFTDADGVKVYRCTIVAYVDAQHVHATPNCALPGGYQNAARKDWTFARNTMAGLGHLEGKTVSILSDGFVEGQQLVVGGQVALQRPGGVVHIGLPITVDFETLDLASSQTNIRDKMKLVNHVSLIVEESMGIWAGPDPDHLTQAKLNKANYDQVASPAQGIMDTRIQATWSKGGRIWIRQQDPLPITILAVIPEVSTGGS